MDHGCGPSAFTTCTLHVLAVHCPTINLMHRSPCPQMSPHSQPSLLLWPCLLYRSDGPWMRVFSLHNLHTASHRHSLSDIHSHASPPPHTHTDTHTQCLPQSRTLTVLLWFMYTRTVPQVGRAMDASLLLMQPAHGLWHQPVALVSRIDGDIIIPASPPPPSRLLPHLPTLLCAPCLQVGRAMDAGLLPVQPAHSLWH
jgi:hypothetical protein